MSRIRFKTTPFKIHDWTIIRLPESASTKLPSRGLTLVEGAINGFRCKIALEPDGDGSHWFRVSSSLYKAAGIEAVVAVTMEVETSKEWPEPDVPDDLGKALSFAPHANALWEKITPMARWDWLRWIRSTNNPETRNHRIDVAISKLKAGKRRPCCFNRNLCTESEVSKNGKLMAPSQTT
ncbi:MAG: YdeI/OmpD-associated family protein [Chitinophagaceae bacterium]